MSEVPLYPRVTRRVRDLYRHDPHRVPLKGIQLHVNAMQLQEGMRRCCSGRTSIA